MDQQTFFAQFINQVRKYDTKDIKFVIKTLEQEIDGRGGYFITLKKIKKHTSFIMYIFPVAIVYFFLSSFYNLIFTGQMQATIEMSFFVFSGMIYFFGFYLLKS